jgi:hypothetical protein
MAEHFPGCHPEDAHAPEPAETPVSQIADTEDCWHCGTPTRRGCNCADCLDAEVYMPPSAIYHCETCERWWAYMTGLNITTITFGEDSRLEVSADSAAPEGE